MIYNGTVTTYHCVYIDSTNKVQLLTEWNSFLIKIPNKSTAIWNDKL